LNCNKEGGQKYVLKCIIDANEWLLKLIPIDSELDEAVEAGQSMASVALRAEREVEILRSAARPTIVALGPIELTSAEIEGNPWLYFTEEFVDGVDLQEQIRQDGPLETTLVVKLARDISDAIGFLWESKKIHRDIKPPNILWATNRDGFVLLDPGIALDPSAPALTAANAIVGTPAYFSPEQADFSKRDSMDFRSDLFALGIVLYEAATGTHPFMTEHGVSPATVVGRIIKDSPTAPHLVNADVPETVSELIMRLLNKPPHLRFRSVDQLHRALNAIDRQLRGDS
jgi:eukaryotic-like serine/threonine-protein kinase